MGVSESFLILFGALLAIGAGVGQPGIDIFGGDAPSLYPLGQKPTYAILVLFALLRTPVWCCDCFLLLFHIYLRWMGMTTYQYLCLRRQGSGIEEQRSQVSQSGSFTKE